MVKKKKKWKFEVAGISRHGTLQKLTLLKPGGSGHVGKPKLRRLKSVGKDSKKKALRNWRHE